MSGIGCAGPTTHCLAANDEKKYAQFFDIDGKVIRPAEVIRLLADKIGPNEMKEIDAEAVAYAPGVPDHYYVTGSHGRARNGGLRLSSFQLFRFAVDPADGRPTFKFGDDDKPAAEIERTELLRGAIATNSTLAPFAEQPLDKCGVTIEGMAAKPDAILFGLRSPAIGGKALVMHIAPDALFKTVPPTATVSALALGEDVGIRDMAAVSDGILLLAGRSLDDAPADDAPAGCSEPQALPVPALWWWDGRSDTGLTSLGALPGVDASMKAEALLLLEEKARSYRVLVLFDGAPNGGPVEFLVTK
jgi:hypothetical protein